MEPRGPSAGWPSEPLPGHLHIVGGHRLLEVAVLDEGGEVVVGCSHDIEDEEGEPPEQDIGHDTPPLGLGLPRTGADRARPGEEQEQQLRPLAPSYSFISDFPAVFIWIKVAWLGVG